MTPEQLAKCLPVAKVNGLSQAQAENCWDCLIGCKGCPFKKEN